MEHPLRVELTPAPPLGLAAFAAALLLAAFVGAPHVAIHGLVVFAVTFPLLWTGVATYLSYSSARALRTDDVECPLRVRAMTSFRLRLTLVLGRYGFPAIGVMTNARFSTDGGVIESGPLAEIPILETNRAGTSQWDVTIKQRGRLRIGPFRAAVGLPGSLLRATAVFPTVRTITVLPAVYHLQPFVDALLAGRHAAAGRYQKVPTAIEEYVGAREYRPGDPPKLIHRVLSLRARDASDFYVREFQDPSRDDLCLVLDTAKPPDGNDELHQYRLEKAICFVAALCRTFAARRLTVRFIYQRGPRDVATLRLRPIDVDLDRLETALTYLELAGDRATLAPVLTNEARRYGAAVIFVSLREREQVAQQRLPMVTLTPDHIPVFTHDVATQ